MSLSVRNSNRPNNKRFGKQHVSSLPTIEESEEPYSSPAPMPGPTITTVRRQQKSRKVCTTKAHRSPRTSMSHIIPKFKARLGRLPFRLLARGSRKRTKQTFDANHFAVRFGIAERARRVEKSQAGRDAKEKAIWEFHEKRTELRAQKMREDILARRRLTDHGDIIVDTLSTSIEGVIIADDKPSSDSANPPTSSSTSSTNSANHTSRADVPRPSKTSTSSEQTVGSVNVQPSSHTPTQRRRSVGSSKPEPIPRCSSIPGASPMLPAQVSAPRQPRTSSRLPPASPTASHSIQAATGPSHDSRPTTPSQPQLCLRGGREFPEFPRHKSSSIPGTLRHSVELQAERLLMVTRNRVPFPDHEEDYDVEMGGNGARDPFERRERLDHEDDYDMSFDDDSDDDFEDDLNDDIEDVYDDFMHGHDLDDEPEHERRADDETTVWHLAPLPMVTDVTGRFLDVEPEPAEASPHSQALELQAQQDQDETAAAIERYQALRRPYSNEASYASAPWE